MYLYVKNGLDKVAAFAVLLFLSPIMLTVMLAILVTDGRPIFFRQTRVGHKLEEFNLLKFRTMTVNEKRDFSQVLDPGSVEITRIGRILRRLKIDELPQLINVLVGDMSIVGPRPPLPSLLNAMNKAQKHRFDVLPGLTGLAQVNGNIHINWQSRFEYDLYYVKHVSLFLDLKIILKTILVVIFGEEKFKGKSNN